MSLLKLPFRSSIFYKPLKTLKKKMEISIGSRVSHDLRHSLKNDLSQARTICQGYKAPERSEE